MDIFSQSVRTDHIISCTKRIPEMRNEVRGQNDQIYRIFADIVETIPEDRRKRIIFETCIAKFFFMGKSKNSITMAIDSLK